MNRSPHNNRDTRLLISLLLISNCPRLKSWGFTIVEMLIGMAIVASLAAIAVPAIGGYIDKARTGRAIQEIRTLEKGITTHFMDNHTYPDSLNDIGRGTLLDPWGNAYEYLNIADANPHKGEMRKDRFLVPVNSDYDLYSKGKDGETAKPFTSKNGRDDVVRANDGGFVGLASDF